MSSAADLLQLETAVFELGVELDKQSVAALTCYVEILLVWRSRMSLTTASTAEEIVNRHIVDSLSVLPHIPRGNRVADIGSGAGFPGLPVAMVRRDTHVTLIEARRKRASFLREVIRQTEIQNVHVCESRLEDLGKEFSAGFDVILSRAFGSVSDFLDLGGKLLRPGGIALAMKGPAGLAEAKPHSGFGTPEVYEYGLTGLGQRLLFKYTSI